MNERWRLLLFVLGALGVAALYVIAFIALPGPDPLRDRYRLAINSRTVPEHNATDAVTAVNFDYRGFDTLGEEFILFVSVMGAMALLRQAEEKKTIELRDAIDASRDVPGSTAIRVWVLAMVAPKVLFGFYIVSHGQLTPGGGFQGGVILATAPLVIYLGAHFKLFKKIVPHTAVDVAEAIGVAGYVIIGMLAFFWGGHTREFLTNVLPMGKAGSPAASGTMPLISLATGLEVAAGFSILLYAFLQELLTKEKPSEQPEQRPEGHA